MQRQELFTAPVFSNKGQNTKVHLLTIQKKMRVTKKQISTLRLASKSSFTLSKLRF